MLLVLFTMILLEVRFSVLNSFFYNGLYSSMQELDADKFWFFAKLNALLVLVQSHPLHRRLFLATSI